MIMTEQLTILDPIDLTSIEYGLDIILSHFEPPYFPRRISTYLTAGRQIIVNNRDEALARFIQSNLLDCRISAYPYSTRGRWYQYPKNYFLFVRFR